MNLNFNQLSFLQRLLTDRPDRRAAGHVALDMAENFGIGVLCGRHVQYAPAHLQRAGQLLTAGGYATEGSPREDQPGGGVNQAILSGGEAMPMASPTYPRSRGRPHRMPTPS